VSLLYGEEEVADFCLDPSTSSGRSGSVGGSGGDYECNVSYVKGGCLFEIRRTSQLAPAPGDSGLAGSDYAK
jgi:hypothetical protein